MHSHVVHVMLCMHTVSFIKPWEILLPCTLNIDVLSGTKWVNKSWNTDNTTLKVTETMWTFAVCDVWMLPQRVRVQRRKRYREENGGVCSQRKWKWKINRLQEERERKGIIRFEERKATSACRLQIKIVGSHPEVINRGKVWPREWHFCFMSGWGQCYVGISQK